MHGSPRKRVEHHDTDPRSVEPLYVLGSNVRRDCHRQPFQRSPGAVI